MSARDAAEAHRQSSFLELFFDLCFVVAVAQAAAALHHALAEDHAASGLVSYLTVFFGIWWAWMNYSWLASAYDNDDVPFRLATFLQILGALILAAGVERAFAQREFDVIFVGYVVMRTGLVFLWLRAARHDPARRATCLRYAVGVSAAMLGWGAMFALDRWPLWGWWGMAAVELAIPVWAERAGATSWHPGHIAERYGLFTIIVLGESVLAATQAVRAAMLEAGAAPDLLAITAGGVLTLFALWWLYFARAAAGLLTSTREAFRWGYGHYFVFAAGAAVGAGLGVNVDHATGRAEAGALLSAASLSVPVAVFLLVLWSLHFRAYRARGPALVLRGAGLCGLAAATFCPWPVLATGLVCAGLAAGQTWSDAH